MPRRPLPCLRPGLLAPAIAAWLLATPEAVIAAEPPAGTSFDIWYYKTNEDGERENSKLFSQQDLTTYVNRARCQCGQDISTRMRLQRAMTSYDNSKLISTYVGSRCDEAQNNPSAGQALPCVKILGSSASAYTLGLNFSFEPIWLAGGTERGGSQNLVDATPSATCESGGEGDAGVWICIEDGTTPNCQGNEFQVNGTQNKNAAMGMAQAIRYDFQPPNVLPTSFEIDEGDGAVVISWDQDATDNSAFRVLCADADGNPLPGKGIDNPPSLTAVSQGTIYFTEGNLCPDGKFNDADQELPSDTGESDGGGSDGGTDDGTTGGDADTTAGVVDELEIDWEFHGGVTSSGTGDASTTSTGTTGTGATATSDSGSGTGGSGTGGSGTGGAGTGGSGTSGGELPATGIQSLDWDYVCTGHIAGNSRSARIEGLENGREYQFLVVTYDPAGNPAASPDILVATPRETIDLWEQCEIQGEVCGDGGFCACTTDAPRGRDAIALLGVGGLGLIGWARRRRRRR